MLYGINAGILDADKYLPVVKKGWEALVKAVDTEGKVGWTQMVAAKPGSVEEEQPRIFHGVRADDSGGDFGLLGK